MKIILKNAVENSDRIFCFLLLRAPLYFIITNKPCQEYENTAFHTRYGIKSVTFAPCRAAFFMHIYSLYKNSFILLDKFII